MENEIMKHEGDLIFKVTDDNLEGKYQTDDFHKRHDVNKLSMIVACRNNQLEIILADYYPWMNMEELPSDSFRAFTFTKTEVVVLIDELSNYKNKMDYES